MIALLFMNKKKERRSKIGNKKLFATYRRKLSQINKEPFHEEKSLRVQGSKQRCKEGNTRILLHVKHASSRYEILVSSPDNNVFVICLSVDLLINAKLLFVTGVKSSKRNYLCNRSCRLHI